MQNKLLLIFLCLLLVIHWNHAQEKLPEIAFAFVTGQVVLKKNVRTKNKYTINGMLSDALTGESLIGANVYIASMELGTTSNSYGFYSITLPEGEIMAEFSYIGYVTEKTEIHLDTNTTLNVQLQPEITSIPEVVIKGKRTDFHTIRSTSIGNHYLSSKEIRSMPGIGGQPDVLKSLQLFPGIVPLNDGIALYSVRGGSSDQNLILLDEAPVYNPSHVLGFLSVFNPDAIHSVEIMKGHIPARFGGRLSSVADIRMKEGNRNRFSMTGFIDPFSGGLTVESPVKTDKTSFLVSGRYFNLTPVSKLAEALREIVYLPGLNNFDENNKIHFYDANIKINRRFSNKDQLFLSTYNGRDGFYFAQLDDRSRQEWGNTTATLRWNRVTGKKVFYNMTALFSRYNYLFNLHDGAYRYNWQADMNQGELKADFDYYPNPGHHLELGGQVTYLNILPGKITPADTNSFASDFTMRHRSSIEPTVYFCNTQEFNNRLSLDYGLRISSFISLYNHIDTTGLAFEKTKQHFIRLEPRFSLRYLIKDNLSFKASYNRLNQPLHMLSNATVGMPTDIWIPSDQYIQPQLADHFSAGLYYSFSKNRLETSMETFYKRMNHIIDFKDNASLRLNELIENEILSGKGRAYGLEYLIRKSQGKLSGWISYTLSKTEKRIEQINNGGFYPSNYDHRHNFSAFISQVIGKRLSLSVTFNYRTGNAITFPLGTFSFKGSEYYIYTNRNGYRLPEYHRLDFDIKFRSNPAKKYTSEWSLSMFNAYGRKNVFAYYNNKMIYLPGTIPVIRYSFKF